MAFLRKHRSNIHLEIFFRNRLASIGPCEYYTWGRQRGGREEAFPVVVLKKLIASFSEIWHFETHEFLDIPWIPRWCGTLYSYMLQCCQECDVHPIVLIPPPLQFIKIYLYIPLCLRLVRNCPEVRHLLGTVLSWTKEPLGWVFPHEESSGTGSQEERQYCPGCISQV